MWRRRSGVLRPEDMIDHVPAPSQALAIDKSPASRGGHAPARPARIDHNFTARSRAALAITLTEDNAIAAAAMIGDNSKPKIG